MRILFVATDPRMTIGYSRIGNIISNDLARRGHEVHYFAFQKCPASATTREIHPKIKFIDVATEAQDTFGVDIFAQTVDTLKPDIIFLYNDVVVTSRLLNTLLNTKKKCPVISYLDLVYENQSFEMIQHVDNYCDFIYVFSDCWKKSLANMGMNAKKIGVFPHGVSECFHRIQKTEARMRLGIPDDAFLVINSNRNSYRKALDISIRAFLQFFVRANKDPRIKFLQNCRFDVQEGYDIPEVIRTECRKLGLEFETVVNETILRLGGNTGFVSDSVINDLHNAADVGINTCVGEGFGLCNLEGAYLGVPQIVTRTGGLGDIFAGHPRMLVDPIASITLARGIDTHMGDISIARAEDFADRLYAYYSDENMRLSDGAAISRHVSEKYAWPNLLDEFHESLLKKRTRSPYIPTFVINLEHRADRLEHFEDSFSRGHEYEIIKAVHDPNSPHVGCLMSHRKALLYAFEDQLDLVIICEDDVVFPADFYSRVAEVLERLPVGWDAVQLHTQCPVLNDYKTNYDARQQLIHGYFMSCACYVFNWKGLKKFAARFGPEPKLTDAARAEELVFRYVDTYTVARSLVNTNETLGSDIPENSHGINARNSDILSKPAFPYNGGGWNDEIQEIPFDLHHAENVRDIFPHVMWDSAWDDENKRYRQKFRDIDDITEKNYSTDWFSTAIPGITESMKCIQPPEKILEIGSWEGRSAVWFLETFPNAHITCVDTFEGSAEHAEVPRNLKEIFEHNTAEFRDRVTVLHGKSAEMLLGLSEGEFDCVYVDGSHEEPDVLGDLVMAYHLLRPGGIMLVDDYSQEMFPGVKRAVDHFASLFGVKKIREDYQIHFKKTGA